MIKKSHGRCSIKKAVLKKFEILTGKHLCWSSFLIKFINKRLQHRCFPLNIAKFLRAPTLKNIYERLLLKDGNSLSWNESWKPPIIAQYDAQPRRIKILIVLLFLKAVLIIFKKVSTSQYVSTSSRNTQGVPCVTIFSTNLVAIPLLCALKNIQAKKIFLITPQNEAPV